MKIVCLQSENVKRLKAVRIEPDGSLVIIGGKNEQGKSSVLDSIMYALGGKGAIPSKPLRQGADKGKVRVTLDERDLIVTRTFTEGGGGTLTVENADGAVFRSPQKILDELVGALTFDPLAFSREKPADQARLLRRVVGIDTAKLDAKRAKLYEDRTAQNRETARLEGVLSSMPEHDDAPEEEVSVSDLTGELEAARVSERDAGDAERDAERVSARLDDLGHGLDRLREQESEYEASLVRIRQRISEAETKINEGKGILTTSQEEAKAAAAAIIPAEPIRQRIAEAEEVNVKVRAMKARGATEALLNGSRDTAEDLTAKIAAMDSHRRRLLKEASFPVGGLGFDEDGVTLKGVPFDQASQAERVQVSVAMGLALNPTCRVLLIRDGSLLDQDHLALIADMAEKADAQVWVERVGEQDASAVVIEDGEVKGAKKAKQGGKKSAEPTKPIRRKAGGTRARGRNQKG
jgi:DNA repair exonuclease SbcCD ATPase subunit